MSVLLDTGFLYAFVNAADARHPEACELMARVAVKEFGAPFVTDIVVCELFNLIRSRTKSARLEEAAKALLPLPEPEVKGLSILSLGTALVERAFEEFTRYRDQRISFTDAGLIATLHELRIDMLATFDERLRTLVPTAS